ncbi:MAG: hypothetical protein M1823_007630, partial [Watsoniomyces obsoletus]
MLNAADPSRPSIQSHDGNVNRHPTNASSVYTDRPDPISASTDSRNDSPQSMGGQEEPYSASSYQHNLPSFGNVASFDSNKGSSLTPAATNKISAPDHPPPAVPEEDFGTGLDLVGQSGDESLSHQPSLGYRSVVEQAFDQSQSR